jgi:hypothetical protein
MFENHVYNLMQQLVQEHKSLWRIKNMYLKDVTNDCPECVAFWKKMEADKEDHIRELTKLVKEHL